MLNRRQFTTAALATGILGTSLRRSIADTYTIPEDHLPIEVRLKTKLPAGELHLDPNQFSLFWTLPKGRAMKYSVGVGRQGLYESGEFTVGAKKEWPSWTPTKEMIQREPEHYAQWANGMPGGPTNPLGARALYLFQPQIGDTFLRIHGTDKPWTVGTAVSNGCARLVNEHIMALYEIVPIGTRVVLYDKVAASEQAACVLCYSTEKEKPPGPKLSPL
jgi:hypothetical protein